MTESYSPLSVLFKYYVTGVEIPSNFNLLEDHASTPKTYENAIESWIAKMPKAATYNVVVRKYDK